jgi:hypothetical protein
LNFVKYPMYPWGEARGRTSSSDPGSVPVHDDYRSRSDDNRWGEQQFAAQLLRAIKLGYKATWNEQSGFLIDNPTHGGRIRIATGSFVGHPAQAADGIRLALDGDEAAGRSPRRVQAPKRGTVAPRSNPYSGWTATLFDQSGRHMADRCG